MVASMVDYLEIRLVDLMVASMADYLEYHLVASKVDLMVVLMVAKMEMK